MRAIGSPKPRESEQKPANPEAQANSGWARRSARLRKMGSTGDPPVPVGDSPNGRPRRALPIGQCLLTAGAILVPPGGSPGSTGQWPVLPKNEFPDTP